MNAYTAENEEEYLGAFNNQVDTESNDKKDKAGTSNNGQGDASVSHRSEPIEKNVQCVLDVLPHLKINFVQALLSRYENADTAIAAYLEGNIPPDLSEALQDSDKNQSKLVGNVADATTVSALNTDIRITGAHIKSKPIRRKAEKSILDDKSDIKEFHTRHYEYGYVSEDDGFGKPNEYDDEYDDSYDALVESESRSFAQIIKRQQITNDLVDEVEDNDDSESADDGQPSERRDGSKDFCENPEAVRARWAQRRDAKYGKQRPPTQPSKT